MTPTKKILFWTAFVIMTLPCALIVFNGDSFGYTLLGLAYALVLYKCGRELMPEWARKYWESLCGE